MAFRLNCEGKRHQQEALEVTSTFFIIADWHPTLRIHQSNLEDLEHERLDGQSQWQLLIVLDTQQHVETHGHFALEFFCQELMAELNQLTGLTQVALPELGQVMGRSLEVSLDRYYQMLDQSVELSIQLALISWPTVILMHWGPGISSLMQHKQLYVLNQGTDVEKSAAHSDLETCLQAVQLPQEQSEISLARFSLNVSDVLLLASSEGPLLFSADQLTTWLQGTGSAVQICDQILNEAQQLQEHQELAVICAKFQDGEPELTEDVLEEELSQPTASLAELPIEDSLADGLISHQLDDLEQEKPDSLPL